MSIDLRAAAAACALATIAVAGSAGAVECKGDPSTAKIVVNVSGAKSPQGLMAVTIWREQGFLKKHGSIKVWRDPAQAGAQSFCFFAPAPGVYAIGVYQDLNSDRKINYTLTGPKEPWGFSNNPKALFALPKFSQVRFEARAGETVLNVRLNH